MTSVRSAVEPLFAHNVRLWLRVWAAVQSVGLVVGCYSLVHDAGGIGAFVASAGALSAIGLIALLIAYHAIGFWAHAWILARPWAILFYVPVGWALILGSMRLA